MAWQSAMGEPKRPLVQGQAEDKAIVVGIKTADEMPTVYWSPKNVSQPL